MNNTFLNDQWVIEGIREEIKMFLEVNENENENPPTRICGTQQR
jgi:hypothetical protein